MKLAMTRFWKVSAWCLVIFIFSSIPTLPKAKFIWWDFIIKKAAHVIEYAILYKLAFDAVRRRNNWKTPFLFGLAFALSDEYHQSFIPGRSARLMDVGFDSVGMFAAYLSVTQKLSIYFPNRTDRANK